MSLTWRSCLLSKSCEESFLDYRPGDCAAVEVPQCGSHKTRISRQKEAAMIGGYCETIQMVAVHVNNRTRVCTSVRRILCGANRSANRCGARGCVNYCGACAWGNRCANGPCANLVTADCGGCARCGTWGD